MVKTEKKSESDDVECSEEAPASKGKQKSQGKKRKRSSSESSNETDIILADNALETERNVHISAMRNNLDETSARKILKTVVTNDHVLALVQLQEEAENSSTDDKSVQPKLTRAKVKELKKVSTNKSSAWDLERLELTPIKHIPVKTRPEVKALIAQELPDDEDDDEYEPTHDDVPSDDDHVESCSDLDSQPRTPATPVREPESPRVVKDGPFKVPQDIVSARRKLEIEEEEATIALRTRSKLSLSATSIEHIESTFVPPDDIPMQDVDDLWNEFLNECLNPASNAKNEDDDDADPEYNVAADADAHDEDEESLSNSIIKISKKELNDLVTELFSILPGPEEETPKVPAVPPTHWEAKREPLSDDESEQNTSKTDEIVQTPSLKLKFECPEEDQSVSEESVSNNKSGGETAIEQPSANTQQSDQQSENKTQSNQQSENKTQPEQQVINKTQPDQQNTKQTNADQQSENKTGSDQQNGDETLIARKIVESVKEMNITPKIRPQKSRTPRLTICTVNNNIEISIEEEEPDPGQSCGSMGAPGAPPSLLRKMKPAPETVHIQVDYSVTISPDQVLILQQQLRQHIQLATSNFMQTVVHPIHWKLALTFKDYVVSLTNMALKKEDSVTNVCNLKPAYELIHTWEKSVTEDTEQNRGMIEFLQEEVQKSRRRLRNNTLYGGQFHETFKEVVANSPVFLYPHLLPCMPYRPDTPRRFCYQRSEDTLITLGIDQFWQYVESNPAIYKPPRTKNPRGRPGFIATMELVTKHMFPWMAANRLAAHVMAVRAGADKDNPIYRYFKLNEMPKIEHSLLPFNPQLTLYEQPEHEVPRIWVRYLANTSKRFLSFLRKRSAVHVTRQPTGVKINGDATPETAKAPLPISFTKEIRSSRSTLNETPQPQLVDKFDVNIQVVNQQQPPQQATQQTIPQQATQQTIPQQATQQTIPQQATNQQTQNQVWVPQNFFKLVETSTGAYLVPFQVESETAMKPPNTATSCSNAATILVNTATGPITTAVEMSTIIGNNLPEKRSDVTVSTKHCMCCVILRKICKQRQSRITEFFNKSVKNKTSEVNSKSEKSSKSEMECGCNRVSYQKISNRLRLLIKNHKKKSEVVFKELEKRLKGGEITDEEEKGLDSKDIAHVLWYQLKVFTQASMSKRIQVKKRVNNLLSNFDTDSSSPIQLARDLNKVFDVELLDLYLDFLGFLTPEQADRMGVFKDYFTRNCAKDLMEKVEEQVTDKEARRNILNQLKSVFTATTDACETCAGLLGTMGGYPALARYTFNFFPHRKATRAPMYKMAVEPARITEDQDAINTTCDGPSVTMDYEADHSSSGEDNDAMSVDNEPAATSVPSPDESDVTAITISTVKTEPPTEEPVNSVATEQDSSDYDENSLKIEETIDWTKEEDRSILQILQEYLTREERKDSYENDKSVIEMLEEKKVYILLYESLINRSLEEIKERVLYLLTILVLSERDTS